MVFQNRVTNLVSSEFQNWSMDEGNFRILPFLNTKLWSSKFIELDVCGQLLFANPVTFIVSKGQ